LKGKKLSQILFHTHLEFDKSFTVPIMYKQWSYLKAQMPHSFFVC